MCQLQDVALQGTFEDLKPRAELSGAVMHGNFLLVVSNQAIGKKEDHHAIQVFDSNAPVMAPSALSATKSSSRADDDTCLEADFEGLTLSGDRLYVVGSHSSTEQEAESRQDLQEEPQGAGGLAMDRRSRTLAGFCIHAQARLTAGRKIKTKAVLHDHPMLGAFAGLPSKENGVDIKGLAAKDGVLHLGFRGPVLRENFVPIARVDPSGSDEPELPFVKLAGGGVRDMAATTDGFLILAGPNGAHQDWLFELRHRHPRPMVTGTTGPQGGTVKHLCSVPPDPDGNPEGVAIVSRSATAADVILVYDSGERLIARR